MKKIIVLGKDGQLGSALLSQLGKNAIALGRQQCNFADADFIAQMECYIDDQIIAVINAAAFTQVDQAETRPDKAFRINAEAVSELASWCKKQNIPLVHFSTDYVFDGAGIEPHRETDETNPLNIYGKSKLAGEQAIERHGGKYLIFRTSWVYDAHGKNFFTTIRRLLREKDTINIVADQTGAPTYAPHLATCALNALKSAQNQEIFPSGIYHMCNSGQTSWYGFAKEIFQHEKSLKQLLKCHTINAIPSSQYPTPAERPLNSRLDCSQLRHVLGVMMPHWEYGLNDCFSIHKQLLNPAP